MVLIQVKADVTPLWYEYGVVLAVPQELLQKLKATETDDSNRLVEILDFWFQKFQPGGGPTWNEVALSLRDIGLKKLADDLMKVETTGKITQLWFRYEITQKF